MPDALSVISQPRSGRGYFGWLLLAAGIAVAVAVWQSLPWMREHLLPSFGTISWAWVVAATALNLLYRVINAGGWGLTIRALHQPVELRASARLWLACESLRWVPGSVWSYGSRSALAPQLGLSRGFAALSVTVELLLTIVAWTLTALVGLGLSPALITLLTTLPWQTLLPAFGFATATVSLLLLAFRFAHFRNWCDRQVMRVMDWRQLLAQRPSWSRLAKVIIFYFILCLFNGLGLWIVLHACTVETPGLMGVICANAIGWLIGFFAVFSPGGLGVREAGIAFVLAPVMPLEQALLGAALWRLVQVVAEIAGLGLIALWPNPAPAKS